MLRFHLCRISNESVFFFVRYLLVSEQNCRPHGVYLLMTFSNHSPDAPVAKATGGSECQMMEISLPVFVRDILRSQCASMVLNKSEHVEHSKELAVFCGTVLPKQNNIICSRFIQIVFLTHMFVQVNVGVNSSCIRNKSQGKEF